MSKRSARFSSAAFSTTETGSPSTTPRFLDLRLAKGFGRWKARLDLLNVTNRNWEEIGLALPDARGELVPYYFPAAGFTARAGVEWSIQ